MEILEKFGFDPVILVAQIINFLIILYLLKRFLYKPILKIINDRQESVKKSLVQIEDAKKNLDRAQEERVKILIKAKDDAKSIIDDAKDTALELSKNINEDAKAETERLINDAKQQIEKETFETEKRLSQYTIRLARELLQKTLENELGKTDQKKILQNAIKKIK
ncbi:MAG: ATP synthase F0 subunit B [Candidatus Levybacteria bacterium RIFCSPHIGHO2_01_FULL_37_17]|nr:MAG: ATP synthase F0 subunit B [Candidatus Levybacteria bacterium RIFCSPHIGHO2_01_FULL_37_17]OGH36708.1 MAG: ATP synthase F0 subunit B [Candidatus Levybacteria bacterium RIFCSPLOWO2_01_FULL_38_23]